MRQKRSKSYKKQMLVYKNTFKFRLPYQIICDEHIIEETYTKRYNLLNNLNKILQPNIIHASSGSKHESDDTSLNPKKTLKLFVTQCSMQHIYESKNEDLIEFVKYNFERRRCNHDYKNPKTSEDCIFSITNVTGKKDENEGAKDINNMIIGSNKHKYIICTQDINLRRKLRRVPGVPIVHFMNSNVLLLEPISDTTKRFSEDYEAQKLTKGLNDSKNAGFKRSAEQLTESTATPETPAPLKKKKTTHNPNPLSVKKKAPKVPVHDKNDESKEEVKEPLKKKRKRVRSKKKSEESAEDGDKGEEPEATNDA